jgi:PEP-CTERM motif
MRILLFILLVGVTFIPIQASTLNTPPPVSAPPDIFGPCAGCTQLAYTSNTAVTATFTATLAAAVYSDPSNTFCAGCLDFVYQISSSSVSTDNISRVTANSFAGVLVDAGYSTSGEPADGGTAYPTGTFAPALVDRNSSDTIGFEFSGVGNGVAPGAASTVLVIETNAQLFAPGSSSALDGSIANFRAYEPTNSNQTPEPASALMLGLGIAALAGLRRFRRSDCR